MGDDNSAKKTKINAQEALPSYIEDRLKIWERAKQKHNQWIAEQPRVAINITLPNGEVKEGKSWETTPFNIAEQISQGLANDVVVAKVNGVLWDLDRPLIENCSLELLKFSDNDGNHAFWHSSAHMLGEALERYYGGQLCVGPPVENGFYYDMFLDGRTVSEEDLKGIETIVKNIQKEKQPFERLEMTKEDLLEMFKYNTFKTRILNEKVTTPTTTVYRCGTLIDLCRGPHVRHTGKVKAFAVTKNSGCFWEGDVTKEPLQRVYGISFPDTKQLKEWKKLQEEAAKRDHRKIGRDQELFFFHELSPGSCFFLPKGAHIYSTLMKLIKEEYWARGFQEVISPNMYNVQLWEKSGHWQHYKDNMFITSIEKSQFALKPMNCPGHCLMFAHRPRSWRELPLRMADFGVLHRNEVSGALTGLTRVRRFQQDDAHIFCRQDQIKDEIKGCLDFLQKIYEVLEFTFELQLSTKPEKFMGDEALWAEAEKKLEESLNEFGKPWTLNPGDGAFYGPKIDIIVRDALKRSHQCATIQLDFQLPVRFNLEYESGTTDADGSKPKPVIIHRAILGSVERMIAVLCEHYGGKWPFWLSPRQAIVVPVVSNFDAYGLEVQQKIMDAGILCDISNDSGDTLNKKIRNAQIEQYNFILVVGEKEASNGTVNVRTRDNKQHGEHKVDYVLSRFDVFSKERNSKAEEQF